LSTGQSQWGPPAAGIIAAGILGVVLGLGALTLVTDPPGRALVGLAGVGLLVFTVMSWRGRPKLEIADQVLVFNGWWHTLRLARTDIKLIRITEFRRIGRKVRLLEIDATDGRLMVLSRWDLGTDPLQVLDALTDAGFAPGPG
jgi:hypothetical protein